MDTSLKRVEATKRAREFWDQRMKIRAENRPEAEFDALLQEEQKEETALFSRSPHAKDVGAFVGAN